MAILSALLAIVGTLAALSIILVIITLIKISSVSSRIIFLESEIDKKAKEFNDLKKDHDAETAEKARIIENSASEDINDMLQKGHDDGSQIEIVRSVRTQDSNVLSRETARIDHAPVEQGKTGTFQTVGHHKEPICIPLFSSQLGAMDLQSAWQTISDSLQKIQQPHFILDLLGIGYIDEQTAANLEYFASTTVQYGGTIEFINCAQEILPTLQKYPFMSQRIRYQ